MSSGWFWEYLMCSPWYIQRAFSCGRIAPKIRFSTRLYWLGLGCSWQSSIQSASWLLIYVTMRPGNQRRWCEWATALRMPTVRPGALHCGHPARSFLLSPSRRVLLTQRLGVPVGLRRAAKCSVRIRDSRASRIRPKCRGSIQDRCGKARSVGRWKC